MIIFMFVVQNYGSWYTELSTSHHDEMVSCQDDAYKIHGHILYGYANKWHVT